MVADATRGVRVSTGALVDGWMDGWRAGQRRSAEAGPLPLPQCLSLEARKDRLVDGQRVVRSLVRAADGTHSHARTLTVAHERRRDESSEGGSERARARESCAGSEAHTNHRRNSRSLCDSCGALLPARNNTATQRHSHPRSSLLWPSNRIEFSLASASVNWCSRVAVVGVFCVAHLIRIMIMMKIVHCCWTALKALHMSEQRSGTLSEQSHCDIVVDRGSLQYSPTSIGSSASMVCSRCFHAAKAASRSSCEMRTGALTILGARTLQRERDRESVSERARRKEAAEQRTSSQQSARLHAGPGGGWHECRP